MKALQNTIDYKGIFALQKANFLGMTKLSVCYYTYRHFATPFLFKLTIFLSTVIFIVSTPTYSKVIDLECARQIAMPLFHNNQAELAKSTDTYYIFVSEDNTQFAIIAKDDNFNNLLLGYSESGGWTEEQMPPILLQWLNSIDAGGVRRERKLQVPASRVSAQRENVPTLMSSRWHQDSPYNDMCPRITDGNIKTAAGCVAIASAQVVYYWRKDNPIVTSEDTPTYPYGKAPVTYSVPAGTEFNWDLMKDFYSQNESDEEKNAVAQLVYIIGTSTYLQYGTSTGGQINDIINPFSKQFRLNAKYASKKNYSQEEWEQLIYSNLKKKQPVVYAGSTGADGHAVVIDGYNANTNLFHFNFGWGGNGDGYYTIDDISGMNGYALGQECVHDVYPREKNLKILLNISDELTSHSPSKIDLFVQNGSTFDIDGLYLFLSKNFIFPSSKDDAIWHHDDKLKNDNSELSFSVQFTPNISGSRCYLILTDGELNILAQKNVSIQESSDINEIGNAVEDLVVYYSIDGRLLHQKPEKGIYIKKERNKTSKVTILK